jgi:4-cresol dehydrogenase (hydroxylating)
VRAPAAILPAGVSGARFEAAIQAFRAAVGAANVLTGDAALQGYRDPHSLNWNEAAEYLASAAVLPASVEEVQAVVRIAIRYGLPLYPISTGRNLALGGAAPGYRGSVVVDLKRMNRILEVDEGRAFALVEPGVTYFDLYNHIQARGLKLWLDVPDPGQGSLVGNALDRGVGYTGSSFRDHFGAHCGLEAVLPTGEIVRTGTGALPGAASWQDFPYAPGPAVEGLFCQGNFGIVTKMGFRLMPAPEAWFSVGVQAPNYTDLQRLIDQVSFLEDAGIVNGRPLYHCTGVHPFEGRFPSAAPRIPLEELMADGWPSLERIVTYSRRHGGPSWRCDLQIYGPPEVLEAKWAWIRERMIAAIPRCDFQDVQLVKLPLTAEEAKRRKLVTFGVPNTQLFDRTAAQVAADEVRSPNQGFSDFMAVLPRTAAAVHRAQRVIYETQKEVGAPLVATPFNAPTAWFHRSLMMGAPTVALFRGAPDQNARGRKLYAAYARNMAAAGFGVYRAPPAMQDLAAAQYGWGDRALLRFQQRLKDAADPHGLVAPGRYGVWPRRLRT